MTIRHFDYINKCKVLIYRKEVIKEMMPKMATRITKSPPVSNGHINTFAPNVSVEEDLRNENITSVEVVKRLLLKGIAIFYR